MRWKEARGGCLSCPTGGVQLGVCLAPKSLLPLSDMEPGRRGKRSQFWLGSGRTWVLSIFGMVQSLTNSAFFFGRLSSGSCWARPGPGCSPWGLQPRVPSCLPAGGSVGLQQDWTWRSRQVTAPSDQEILPMIGGSLPCPYPQGYSVDLGAK